MGTTSSHDPVTTSWRELIIPVIPSRRSAQHQLGAQDPRIRLARVAHEPSATRRFDKHRDNREQRITRKLLVACATLGCYCATRSYRVRSADVAMARGRRPRRDNGNNQLSAAGGGYWSVRRITHVVRMKCVISYGIDKNLEICRMRRLAVVFQTSAERISLGLVHSYVKNGRKSNENVRFKKMFESCLGT